MKKTRQIVMSLICFLAVIGYTVQTYSSTINIPEEAIHQKYIRDTTREQTLNPVLIGMSRAQEKEVECLAKTIYFEARGETELGKIAVARVVINRSTDPRFPNSVCKVVHQVHTQPNKYKKSCQFSWYCRYRNARIEDLTEWEVAKRIAYEIMILKLHSNVVPGATFFHNVSVHPPWATKQHRVAKIDRHIFYRK